MELSSHHKEALETQIREAYGRVTYTYTAHLKMMNALAEKNMTVKYLQIALSAISTGGFIGAIISNEIILTCVGGLFSTGLLALNLYFKEFNLFNDIKEHCAAADDLWFIREKYVSLLTDLTVLTEAEIVSQRDDLQKLTHKIYKHTPKTNSRSYADAQKALKSDEEQYFTAEEIDRMLPSHLRKHKED